jgi:hypothetical protein
MKGQDLLNIASSQGKGQAEGMTGMGLTLCRSNDWQGFCRESKSSA